MRDDDLDDDALEREQLNPMMAGGPKHAPKLGTESRAINMREAREEAELPSDRRREGAAQLMAEFPPSPPVPGTTSTSQVAHLRPPKKTNVTPLRSGRASPSRDDERAAWDRFLVASLPITAEAADDLEHNVELAALLADLILEKRKERFR